MNSLKAELYQLCINITGWKLDPHKTNTFQHFLQLANTQNLKVIQTMYSKDIDVLDNDAIDKMLSAVFENENFKKNPVSVFDQPFDANGFNLSKMDNGKISIAVV